MILSAMNITVNTTVIIGFTWVPGHLIKEALVIFKVFKTSAGQTAGGALKAHFGDFFINTNGFK